MLIKALADHARSAATHVPAGYATKTLGFTLAINEDLGGCTLLSRYTSTTDDKGKARRVPTLDIIPNLQRSGTKPKPFLGCDTAAYVLGRASERADAEAQAKENAMSLAKAQAFDALLQDYVDEVGDIVAERFLRWRAAGSPGLEDAISRLDDFELSRIERDPIAIRVGVSPLLHSSASAQQFWSARAVGSKSSGDERNCLSCGEFGPVVDTLPQMLSGANIPATNKASVALSSVNFPSASRGASGSGLKSAPICAECATSAVRAFNTLASSEDHRWGGRNDGSGTIWWTRGGTFDVAALDNPDPARIKDFLDALHRSQGERTLDINEFGRFFALTFSGNGTRLVVRQWIDISLTRAHEHVSEWFRDTSGPRLNHEHPTLSDVAKSAGSFTRHEGRWVETTPEGVREALLITALISAQPPRSLLARAIARTTAEVRYTTSSDGTVANTARRRADSRFGLIRLILNRTVQKENPLNQYIDEDRSDSAYLSGRIFAMRENIQHVASGGKVNSTIVDRYFERASANPASVERALEVLKQQHLKAVRRKVGEGAAISLGKQVDSLLARMGDAPGRLSAEGQAMWIAGYHQQRQDHFNKIAENKASAASNTEENK